MSVERVARVLGPLASYVSLSQVYKFWHVAVRIRNDILAVYPSYQPPEATPLVLPPDLRDLLSKATTLSDSDVKVLWEALRDLVWKPDVHFRDVQDDRAMAGVFGALNHHLFREFIIFSLTSHN
jgi:hypothetical protein